MQDLVQRLLSVEEDLVVTITTPLDRRHPGHEADKIRLRNLVREAAHRVKASSNNSKHARQVVENLERAASELDLAIGADGAVIVATPTMAEAHTVPFPVREAVEVGTTPATRYLVQGLRRSPRYRVLVISERSAHLFEGIRDALTEVQRNGFPLESDIVHRDRRAVAGRFALAPSGDDKEPWRNFFRQVDAALSEVTRGDQLPIILAGVRPSTALFEEVSSNVSLVIGRLDGAYEKATPHELAQAAWPIMRERLRQRRLDVVAELVEALHTGRAVAGIDETWMYAKEGRGRLLVVEEDYRAAPSREVDGRLVPAADADPAEVMDDPVDELIELVVRAGGTVEFVASGALAEHGHVGLLLR